jgi:hypothetical protein
MTTIPNYPEALDLKTAFLAVFRACIADGHSTLDCAPDGMSRDELREDLATAISESFAALRMIEPPAEDRATVYEWIAEDRPDIAEALDATEGDTDA